MKKILISLFILLLMPVVVMADVNDLVDTNDGNTTTSSTTITNTESVTKSPDTGVEDYFLTLGVVSICLAGTLYIVNKKKVFAEI